MDFGISAHMLRRFCAARVLNKFQECGFEKVERLLELRETYAARSEKARKKTMKEAELDELDKEVPSIKSDVLNMHLNTWDNGRY